MSLKTALRGAKKYAIAFGSGFLAALALLWYFITKKSINSRNASDKRVEDEKRINADESGRSKTREEKAKELEKRRSTLIAPLIILLILGSASKGFSASPQPYIPADYNSLKQNYLTLWDLSEEYRKLYFEAEESVKVLQESNSRLLQIVEEQRKEIEKLKQSQFGVVGGLTWSSSGPGLFLGGSFNF